MGLTCKLLGHKYIEVLNRSSMHDLLVVCRYERCGLAHEDRVKL